MYDAEVIAESAVIAQFLADTFPPGLAAPSNSPGAALQRARIALFVDTYDSRVHPQFIKAVLASTAVEVNDALNELVSEVVGAVEPMLLDANPFFHGSSSLTLSEVCHRTYHLRQFHTVS